MARKLAMAAMRQVAQYYKDNSYLISGWYCKLIVQFFQAPMQSFLLRALSSLHFLDGWI